MSATTVLLNELIAKKSITPEDAGCQDILIKKLTAAGFQITPLPFGEVKNFWAWHGNSSPTLVFAGHTDVVPPGNESAWHSLPFSPTERDGYIFGRGACDMKSGLAAMIIAAINFVKQNPNHSGTIGFIVTSDEEGPAENGTRKVTEYLQKNNINVDYCIVGEASSNKVLGDAIKVGRRGSMYGNLVIHGKQGHIAYPHLADNPIHRSFQAFDALAKKQWDQGNEHFTPTSFQFYNVHADAGAQNVIPGILTAHFNFRFAPIRAPQELQQEVHYTLDQHHLNYELKWDLTSEPFYSGHGHLATAAAAAIQTVCGISTEPNTYGGTSDGRFIAKMGAEVIELGPVNATAHHINESTSITELNQLTIILELILQNILQRPINQ